MPLVVGIGGAIGQEFGAERARRDDRQARDDDCRDMAIEALILSGYPHAAEADLFA